MESRLPRNHGPRESVLYRTVTKFRGREPNQQDRRNRMFCALLLRCSLADMTAFLQRIYMPCSNLLVMMTLVGGSGCCRSGPSDLLSPSCD